jgi:hypothetical protein
MQQAEREKSGGTSDYLLIVQTRGPAQVISNAAYVAKLSQRMSKPMGYFEEIRIIDFVRTNPLSECCGSGLDSNSRHRTLMRCIEPAAPSKGPK